MKLTGVTAIVSSLPYQDGDGYSYGGGVILTIGDRAILLSPNDHELAKEIAHRWNAGRLALEQNEKEG